MPDGRLHSFGMEPPQYRADMPHLSIRRLTRAGGSRFWTAYSHAYRLELWDRQGEKLSEIVRIVDWFAPAEQLVGRSMAEVPPNPSTEAIWLDGNHLWVLIRVPDANWKPLPGGRRSSEGGARIVEGHEFGLVYDAMIEVIDPETKQVLASKRFPQFTRSVFNGRDVFVYVEDEDGNPSFHVYRPTLVRRP